MEFSCIYWGYTAVYSVKFMNPRTLHNLIKLEGGWNLRKGQSESKCVEIGLTLSKTKHADRLNKYILLHVFTFCYNFRSKWTQKQKVNRCVVFCTSSTWYFMSTRENVQEIKSSIAQPTVSSQTAILPLIGELYKSLH